MCLLELRANLDSFSQFAHLLFSGTLESFLSSSSAILERADGSRAKIDLGHLAGRTRSESFFARA